MFESIFSAGMTPARFLIMALAALGSGVVFSWLMSLRVRATRRFFIVTSIIPFVVGMVLAFVNGNIGAGVAFGGAFALIRFRSAPGSAEEIAAVLIAMSAGVAFGMGYVVCGVLVLLGLGALFLMLSSVRLFDHATLNEDRLLKVTVPESFDFTGAFDDVFERFLKSAESVGVKTTGMGSMFRLSYRIRMKDRRQEKALIDELRTRNGNLEISIMPYTGDAGSL